MLAKTLGCPVGTLANETTLPMTGVASLAGMVPTAVVVTGDGAMDTAG